MTTLHSPKITPFLWFNNQAEEAVSFYLTIFQNGKVLSTMGPKGNAMGVTFQLGTLEMIAFNGGPNFQLNEAFSLMVSCDTQAEIDYLWEHLSEGGQKSRCGWLQDKFGLWWQIVPPVLAQLLQGEDRDKAGRVMQKMLQMDKLVIKALEEA